MAAIDKAAIAWTIAIVVAGAGIAGMGDSLQGIGPSGTVSNTAPTTTTESMETTPTDPFADISSKVQEQATEREAAMQEQMQMASTSEEEPMEMMEEEPMEMMEEPAAVTAGPKTVVVTVPAGTSVPGCEETNECYLPPSVSINTGDTISWDNVDTAAHTVTSGTPADGPDGIFDSSLLMGGASFEVTFDESGSYDYFCMVHPWMIGDVQVS